MSNNPYIRTVPRQRSANANFSDLMWQHKQAFHETLFDAWDKGTLPEHIDPSTKVVSGIDTYRRESDGAILTVMRPSPYERGTKLGADTAEVSATTIFPNAAAEAHALVTQANSPQETAGTMYDSMCNSFAASGDIEKIKRLIAKGAALDPTMLSDAVRNDDLWLAKFLIEDAHLDIEVKDHFGRRPLEYVRSKEMLDLLVQHGVQADDLGEERPNNDVQREINAIYDDTARIHRGASRTLEAMKLNTDRAVELGYFRQVDADAYVAAFKQHWGEIATSILPEQKPTNFKDIVHFLTNIPPQLPELTEKHAAMLEQVKAIGASTRQALNHQDWTIEEKGQALRAIYEKGVQSLNAGPSPSGAGSAEKAFDHEQKKAL